MKIIWEIRALVLLCLVDLVSTVWLLHTGNAVEANPVMEFYLSHGGAVCFVVMKAFLLLGPLFVLEQIRKTKPQFIRMLLRSCVAAYILLYGVGSWYVNATSEEYPTVKRLPAVVSARLNG